MATGFRNVNEVILDRIITHGAILEQYTHAEIRQLVSFLTTQVEPDIVRQLQKYAGRDWTTRRLRALRESIEEIVHAGYLRMRKRAFGEIEQFAQVENRWNIRMLAGAVPIEIALVTPSIPTIREMIRNKPVNGRFLSEWFADLAPATLGRVNQQIMLGITQGEGIDQIVRRLVGSRERQYRDGILQRSRRSVEGFVRTAVAGVPNNVRQETYRHNARVIASIQWVATLDFRTCEACGAQDGRRYAIDDGPRPPLHPACRCTTAPVLKSWKEMGIDLREAPANVRASMSGLVPDAVTFPDWLQRQPRQVQERVLGKRKTELFRSGQVKFAQFVDTVDRSRILTLAQLEEIL